MTFDLVVLTIAKEFFLGLVLPALAFLIVIRLLIWLIEDIHERMEIYYALRGANKPERESSEPMQQATQV